MTHDFNVASRMGGDMLVMKDGQIVEQGNNPRSADYAQASIYPGAD